MIRSTHVLTAALMLACLPLTRLPAQGPKGGEFIPGTVVSIEKDKTGRNYKMKVKNTADDSEFDVPITPRTPLLVTAKGDEGFLRKDVFIVVKEALKGATEFSGKEFTVHLGSSPQPGLKLDPTKPSKTVYEMSGKVLASEGGTLMVQCGAQPQKLTVEAGATVSVILNNPAQIKEGDAVVVEGTLIKSKKQLNAKSIKVTSSEDLNAEEYFASLEDQKKSKNTKTKTPTKSKTEAGEAGATSETADPFGVLKGKKATKSKTDKAADTDAKKEQIKKDEPKKEAAAKAADKPATATQ